MHSSVLLGMSMELDTRGSARDKYVAHEQL